MKVLLTGSTGLLGEAFLRLWGGRYEVEVAGRGEMDLGDLAAVQQYLEEREFDVLVNPAGMTGLEQCLDAVELAGVVNGGAPRVMAEVCRVKGAKLVHFSTDYVFGGEVEKSLTEGDVAEPVNDYGVSKLAGEAGVLEEGGHLVCRVSWIFGHGRDSVLDQVFKRARGGEELRFIQDKWSVPTYADAIVGAVEQMLADGREGLFHVCSDSQPVSWWEYAYGVVEEAVSLGLLESEDGYEVERGWLDEVEAFRAVRPRHTAMGVGKLRACGIEMPGWRESARRLLMEKYGE